MKNIEKVAQIIKLLVLDVDGVMTDGSSRNFSRALMLKMVWESAAL